MKKKILKIIITILVILAIGLIIQYGFKIPILDIIKAIIQGLR